VVETFLSIYDVIKPTLRRALSAAQDWVARTRPVLVSIFDAMVKAARDAYPTVREIVLNIAQGFLQLYAAVAPVFVVIGRLFLYIATNSGVISELVSGLGVWALALWAVHKAATAVNAVMALNPVLATLTIVAGLASLVAHRMGGWTVLWESIATGAKKMWVALQYVASGLWNWFSLLATVLGETVLSVKRIFVAIGQVIAEAVSAIGSAMGSMARAIMNPFRAVSIISEAQQNMSDSLGRIRETAVSGWDDISGAFTGAWDTFNAANAVARRDYDQETQRLDIAFQWRKKRLLQDQKEQQQALEQWMPKMPSVQMPQLDMAMQGAENAPAWWGKGVMSIEPPTLDTGKLHDTMKGAMSVFDEFKSGLSNTFESAWDSIIDSSRTGAEKWKAIWKDTTSFIFGLLGKITLQKILGDKLMWESSKETNRNEQAENTKTAATGFFKAYAAMPFVGQALALASIAAMIGFLGKMHDGGPVTGTGEQVRVLMANEYVMPVEQSRRNFGLLEAIRRGETPVASAAGDGGPRSITAIVQVPEGSLLMADDRLAVRRMAVMFNDELERIQENYKGT